MFDWQEQGVPFIKNMHSCFGVPGFFNVLTIQEIESNCQM